MLYFRFFLCFGTAHFRALLCFSKILFIVYWISFLLKVWLSIFMESLVGTHVSLGEGPESHVLSTSVNGMRHSPNSPTLQGNLMNLRRCYGIHLSSLFQKSMLIPWVSLIFNIRNNRWITCSYFQLFLSLHCGFLLQSILQRSQSWCPHNNRLVPRGWIRRTFNRIWLWWLLQSLFLSPLFIHHRLLLRDYGTFWSCLSILALAISFDFESFCRIS